MKLLSFACWTKFCKFLSGIYLKSVILWKEDRIQYTTVTKGYKSLNNLAPEYMTNMFTYIQDFHQRETRSLVRKDLCLLSGRHKNLFTNSFAYKRGLCCGTIYTLILGTVILWQGFNLHTEDLILPKTSLFFIIYFFIKHFLPNYSYNIYIF